MYSLLLVIQDVLNTCNMYVFRCILGGLISSFWCIICEMNRTLLLIYLTGLIIGTSYGMHTPLLPVFAKNAIGATYSELGLIGLANFVPYMFIPFFVGILIDRFNNGYLLAVGAVLNSVSIYLLSVVQNVPEVMGLRVLTGVAHAFFWPPCESIISAESSSNNRVQHISLFTMFFVIGFMVGPLLGNLFLEGFDVSHRILFQITAFVLSTAIITALITSKKRQPKRVRSLLSSIHAMKQFPEVIVLLIFFTATFGIILTIYPAFLNDRGMNDTDILYLYFIFGISRVVSLAFGGKLARYTSRTLIAATASISVGLGISAISVSFVEFAIALGIMGFGFAVFSPLTLEIILSKTRKRIFGSVIGMYEAVFGIGWVIGPTIGGPMAQIFTTSMPYIVLCVVGLGVFAMSITRYRYLEPNQ